MSQTVQPRGSNFEYTGEFGAGLFECCADCKTLACAYFCFPCFLCDLYKDAGECMCTPFFCPQAQFMLRSKVRAHYKIEGALWKDVFAVACCPWCAAIQLANELRIHGDN